MFARMAGRPIPSSSGKGAITARTGPCYGPGSMVRASRLCATRSVGPPSPTHPLAGSLADFVIGRCGDWTAAHCCEIPISRARPQDSHPAWRSGRRNLRRVSHPVAKHGLGTNGPQNRSRSLARIVTAVTPNANCFAATPARSEPRTQVRGRTQAHLFRTRRPRARRIDDNRQPQAWHRLIAGAHFQDQALTRLCAKTSPSSSV